MLIACKTDVEKFAINPRFTTLKGVRSTTRIFVAIDDILVDPLDNTVRYGGTDSSLVQDLKNDFLRGVRYTEFLPVIEKLPVSKKYDNDGKVKYYILRDGFNRVTALKELGVTHYWFDVVEFGYDGVPAERARNDFALNSNYHAPSKSSSDKDIYNAVSNLVSEDLLEKDFMKIKDYIREICGVTPARSHNIASQVCANAGIAPSIYTWTNAQIKNRETEYFGVMSGGAYDNEREQYGYTMLEDYEKDAVMNVINKYFEERNNRITEGKSYVVAHTKLPTTEADLEERRFRVMEEYNRRIEGLIAVCDFYKENGTLPFELLGFLPQTRVENENAEIVPLLDMSKRKNKLRGKKTAKAVPNVAPANSLSEHLLA